MRILIVDATGAFGRDVVGPRCSVVMTPRRWSATRARRDSPVASPAVRCASAEGQPGRFGHLVRADLAGFLVECATENRHLREAVAVGS